MLGHALITDLVASSSRLGKLVRLFLNCADVGFLGPPVIPKVLQTHTATWFYTHETVT
jgi:hypothetical protein